MALAQTQAVLEVPLTAAQAKRRRDHAAPEVAGQADGARDAARQGVAGGAARRGLADGEVTLPAARSSRARTRSARLRQLGHVRRTRRRRPRSSGSRSAPPSAATAPPAIFDGDGLSLAKGDGARVVRAGAGGRRAGRHGDGAGCTSRSTPPRTAARSVRGRARRRRAARSGAARRQGGAPRAHRRRRAACASSSRPRSPRGGDAPTVQARAAAQERRLLDDRRHALRQVQALQPEDARRDAGHRRLRQEGDRSSRSPTCRATSRASRTPACGPRSIRREHQFIAEKAKLDPKFVTLAEVPFARSGTMRASSIAVPQLGHFGRTIAFEASVAGGKRVIVSIPDKGRERGQSLGHRHARTRAGDHSPCALSGRQATFLRAPQFRMFRAARRGPLTGSGYQENNLAELSNQNWGKRLFNEQIDLVGRARCGPAKTFLWLS